MLSCIPLSQMSGLESKLRHVHNNSRSFYFHSNSACVYIHNDSEQQRVYKEASLLMAGEGSNTTWFPAQARFLELLRMIVE